MRRWRQVFAAILLSLADDPEVDGGGGTHAIICIYYFNTKNSLILCYFINFKMVNVLF